MKMLTGLVLLVLSLASLASTGETKSFTYDGSQNSVELLLKGEKTHTAYRYENRRTTCYRTEIAGYRTVCSGGGGGPRGPRGPQYCNRVPVYRQVAYPCQQTVQIPYEVKDFDVEASVIVDVTKLPGAVTTGETFNVTLFGDSLSIEAVGSKRFFLVLAKEDIRSSGNGSVKYLDGLFAIQLVEAAPVQKALKLTQISLDKPVLNFTMGPVEDRAHIGFSLNATHKRALASDTVLFDRELIPTEIAVNTTAASAQASVNIDQLGIKLTDGKYHLTAKAFFKASGKILNEKQFPDGLEASRTLIYKIR
jgi:hypothetical protein